MELRKALKPTRLSATMASPLPLLGDRGEPACIRVVPVFLRTYVVEVHLVGSSLIDTYYGSMIAVDVILFRTTAKYCVVHPGRQTETYTDAGELPAWKQLCGLHHFRE